MRFFVVCIIGLIISACSNKNDMSKDLMLFQLKDDSHEQMLILISRYNLNFVFEKRPYEPPPVHLKRNTEDEYISAIEWIQKMKLELLKKQHIQPIYPTKNPLASTYRDSLNRLKLVECEVAQLDDSKSIDFINLRPTFKNQLRRKWNNLLKNTLKGSIEYIGYKSEEKVIYQVPFLNYRENLDIIRAKLDTFFEHNYIYPDLKEITKRTYLGFYSNRKIWEFQIEKCRTAKETYLLFNIIENQLINQFNNYEYLLMSSIGCYSSYRFDSYQVATKLKKPVHVGDTFELELAFMAIADDVGLTGTSKQKINRIHPTPTGLLFDFTIPKKTKEPYILFNGTITWLMNNSGNYPVYWQKKVFIQH